MARFIKIKLLFFILLSFLFGQVKAESNPVINKAATYRNPAYVQESVSKVNCDLNGAWTKEFKYFWLANPEDNKRNLPSFVRNLTYKGIVEKTNKIGISTLESLSLDSVRNNYFLTSSLPNEEIEIDLDLEHNNPYVEWFPLNLYFDPFVLEDLNQQVRIKLSYAKGNLGEIVYIQDINFVTGCYLNLLIKSPPEGEIGKASVEIKPRENAKAALSGVFWTEERMPRNLLVNYIGSDKVSAQGFYGKQKNIKKAIFWSPITSGDNEQGKSIVQVSLGDITYSTSTGFEFPLDLKSQIYNYQVLKGVGGEDGINGLEFYIEPPKEACLEGCNLNLYFTENYRQKIYVYSAYEDKKNNLLAEVTTGGEGIPTFENFYIKPNEDVKLRIRIDASEDLKEPVLRGLSIMPPVTEEEDAQIVSSESNENIQNEHVLDNNPTKKGEVKNQDLSSDANPNIKKADTDKENHPVVINIYPVWFESPRPALNSGTRPIINNVRNEDRDDDGRSGNGGRGSRDESDDSNKDTHNEGGRHGGINNVISESVSDLEDRKDDKKEDKKDKRPEDRNEISNDVSNLVENSTDREEDGKGKKSKVEEITSEKINDLSEQEKKEDKEDKKPESENVISEIISSVGAQDGDNKSVNDGEGIGPEDVNKIGKEIDNVEVHNSDDTGRNSERGRPEEDKSVSRGNENNLSNHENNGNSGKPPQDPSNSGKEYKEKEG